MAWGGWGWPIQKGALWYYVLEVSHLGQLRPSHENLLLGVPWVSESIGIVNEAWAVMAVLMTSILLIFGWQINSAKVGQGGPHLAISPIHPNMHQDTTKKVSGHGMRWLGLAHPKGGTVVLCSGSKPPQPAPAKSWKFTSGGFLGLWIHWNCEWGMGSDGCAHGIDFIDFWATN